MKFPLVCLVTTVGLTAVFVSPVQAATLVYGTPTSVPDDFGSVFLNNGTQVFGMNVGNGGAGSHTINGVYFNNGGRSGNVQTQTQGAISLTMTNVGGDQSNGNAIGLYTNTVSPSEPFDILNSNFYSGSGASGSITLAFSGLTIGQEYQVQSFHLESTGLTGSREMTYSVGGSNFSARFEQVYTSGVLSNAVATTFTFNATESTLNVSLLPADNGTGIDRAYLNGITLTAVPEPGTIGLLVAGGLAALIAVRRRRGC